MTKYDMETGFISNHKAKEIVIYSEILWRKNI